MYVIFSLKNKKKKRTCALIREIQNNSIWLQFVTIVANHITTTIQKFESYDFKNTLKNHDTTWIQTTQIRWYKSYTMHDCRWNKLPVPDIILCWLTQLHRAICYTLIGLDKKNDYKWGPMTVSCLKFYRDRKLDHDTFFRFFFLAIANKDHAYSVGKCITTYFLSDLTKD
jgi:hypothetical protein